MQTNLPHVDVYMPRVFFWYKNVEINIQEFLKPPPTMMCGGKQSLREVETIDDIYKSTLDKKAAPL